MKKLIIASSLMVMISLSTFAQQGKGGEKPNPEERAKQMTERLATELELNEAQKNQVLAINMEYAKKREAEMEAMKAEMEARKKAQQEHEAKIQAVLTETQKAKWVELKDERKEHHKGRPGGEVHHKGEMGKKGHRDNK
jgi:periplasmic protein CpxP/Spy